MARPTNTSRLCASASWLAATRAASRVDQMAALHVDLAEVFARRSLELIELGKASCRAQIDIIGSHGQTLWHNVLAQRSGKRFAANRGAGRHRRAHRHHHYQQLSRARYRGRRAGRAPDRLHVDWLLLRHPQHWRAIQNIGGMGNVTFLPPLADDSSAPIAFDTGPGNALLDIAVAQLTDGAHEFDRDGQNWPGRAASTRIGWTNCCGIPITRVAIPRPPDAKPSAQPPRWTWLPRHSGVGLIIRRDHRHIDGADRHQHRRRLPALRARA